MDKKQVSYYMRKTDFPALCGPHIANGPFLQYYLKNGWNSIFQRKGTHFVDETIVQKEIGFEECF